MKVEDPAAFRFILQDEVYLLNADKTLIVPASEPETPSIPEAVPVVVPLAAIPQLAEPEPAALIKPVATAPAPQQTPEPAFNYAGKNLKHFLVLINYPGIELMDTAHHNALTSTLQRIGLTADDVALFNTARYPEATFAQLKTFFVPQKVLILGKEALAAGLERLPLNQAKTSGPITALYTFGFAEMMASNDNKRIFWEQVKNF